MDKTIKDYFYDLDCRAPEADQHAAIQFFIDRCRRDPKGLSMIIQTPFEQRLWFNEAQVICAQDDIILDRYIQRLLEWQIDPNWLGADLIFDRLVRMKGNVVDESIREARRWAMADHDERWLRVLDYLIEQRGCEST